MTSSEKNSIKFASIWSLSQHLIPYHKKIILEQLLNQASVKNLPQLLVSNVDMIGVK